MKSTGMVRRVDELGRIVIPKELRRVFDIGENAPLEMFIEDDKIVIQKYSQGCVICDSDKHLHKIDDKYICNECLSRVNRTTT